VHGARREEYRAEELTPRLVVGVSRGLRNPANRVGRRHVYFHSAQLPSRDRRVGTETRICTLSRICTLPSSAQTTADIVCRSGGLGTRARRSEYRGGEAKACREERVERGESRWRRRERGARDLRIHGFDSRHGTEAACTTRRDRDAVIASPSLALVRVLSRPMEARARPAGRRTTALSECDECLEQR